MAHRVNEYRKRRHTAQLELIAELREENAALLAKVKEQEEELWRISQTRAIPLKPRKTRAPSRAKTQKEEARRIRANMNSPLNRRTT